MSWISRNGWVISQLLHMLNKTANTLNSKSLHQHYRSTFDVSFLYFTCRLVCGHSSCAPPPPLGDRNLSYSHAAAAADTREMGGRLWAFLLQSPASPPFRSID